MLNADFWRGPDKHFQNLFFFLIDFLLYLSKSINFDYSKIQVD